MHRPAVFDDDRTELVIRGMTVDVFAALNAVYRSWVKGGVR